MAQAVGLSQWLGLAPSEFWAMTPWQFQKRLDAFAEQQSNLSDERIGQAWWTEYFARQKKLKPLSGFLNRGDEKNGRRRRGGKSEPAGIDEDALKADFAALRQRQQESVH